MGEEQNEIWDFKTGEFQSAKEGGYWTQLLLYAHGLSVLKFHQKSKIVLKIVYTDEMKIHEKEFNAHILSDGQGRRER